MPADEDLRSGARIASGRSSASASVPLAATHFNPARCSNAASPDAQLRRRALRHGRLFLAGDAAISCADGGEGLNLAASDVHYLVEALDLYYRSKDESGLAGYSDQALTRVWKAQRFSWWMTSMLHVLGGEAGRFEDRIRLAELEYVLSSPAALTTLAENYVGLPF